MNETTNKRPTCKTCPFWYRHGPGIEECRRNPPAFSPEADKYQNRFPDTTADAWCGEHPDMTAWLAARPTTEATPGARVKSPTGGPTNPAAIPADVRGKILAARDALIPDPSKASVEAFHWLYAIADPTFLSLEPWAALERGAVRPEGAL
jgi:hypothetical protein